MMLRRLVGGVVVVAMALLVAGCASGGAYGRGEEAGKAGDWEAAVGYYRKAVQDDPDRPEYKIALERALLSAAAMYVERGQQFEAANQTEEALRAYRKASEFEPSNRQIVSKAAEIERLLRDRMEASAPRPEIEKLRDQARRSVEPILNPASREPLGIRFTNAGIRDVLNFIGNSTGINVTYDRDFQDRSISIQLEGVTLEQALQQIMFANVLFYKVLNERTIIVAADTPQKRAQFEEQVIRTFFVSHTDVTELAQMLTGVIRVAGQAIQPTIVPNKGANTITVRATTAVVQIIERIIETNDKPRAEVMVDVQILEVSRERAKRYGLSLTDYAVGLIFSPEVSPGTAGTAPANVASPPPINLNTISRGVSAADFYLAVPAAVVRFLETDSQTKVLAKPNLRGTEGQKLSLNLGEDVPVPSTTFTPFAGGGAAASPLTSFAYRTIGIIVDMTPRVTYEGDIILEISIENSARGQDSNIAGQNLPSFFSRKVQTKLRLRDGESNLLAGLLREDERRSLRGFTGIMRLPIVKQLFSDNDDTIRQTDIVMLLTPRVIRTHEMKASDLSPIYIGTQGNMALGGPPPLIAVGGDSSSIAVTPGTAPAAPPSVEPPPQGAPTLPVGSTTRPVAPPGSSPIPGMTTAAPAAAPPSPPPAQTPSAAPAVVPPPDPPAAALPVETPGAGAPAVPTSRPIAPPARITLSPPGEMRVGGGPYTVPISVAGATRLSTITISISYNPALVRVRGVQEGTFMRQGGVNATFTQQVDAASGRIDIAIARSADKVGASTSGLLAALLLEPVAAGTGSLNVTGSGSAPGGESVGLQFMPTGVTVR